MPKRSSKTGINELASEIVSAATGSGPPHKKSKPKKTAKKKNPAAVALGRLGGKKGGPARAKNLSPERRKEIAQRAARIRYGQKP